MEILSVKHAAYRPNRRLNLLRCLFWATEDVEKKEEHVIDLLRPPLVSPGGTGLFVELKEERMQMKKKAHPCLPWHGRCGCGCCLLTGRRGFSALSVNHTKVC